MYFVMVLLYLYFISIVLFVLISFYCTFIVYYCMSNIVHAPFNSLC